MIDQTGTSIAVAIVAQVSVQRSDRLSCQASKITMSKQLQTINGSNVAVHVAKLKDFLFIAGLIVLLSSCQKEETADAAAKTVIAAIAGKNPGCSCDPYIHAYKWKDEIV